VALHNFPACGSPSYYLEILKEFPLQVSLFTPSGFFCTEIFGVLEGGGNEDWISFLKGILKSTAKAFLLLGQGH
jgi:hypothetical protein